MQYKKSSRSWGSVATAALLVVLLCVTGAAPCLVQSTPTSHYQPHRRASIYAFLQLLQRSFTNTAMSTWTGDDFCTWTGVSCKYMYFSLDLDSTSVTGSLPELPPEIDASQLGLYVFKIVDNLGLVGTLPASWKALTQLSVFYAFTTSRQGTLPPSWSAMAALQTLDISHSGVTGIIPDSWDNMSALTTVSLASTPLTCCLPRAWLCDRHFTKDGVGLTSATSASCAAAAEVFSASSTFKYSSTCPTTTTSSSTTTAPTTSTEAPPAQSSESSESSVFPAWAIALVVVIPLIAATGVGIAVFLCCCRRRNAARDDTREEEWEEMTEEGEASEEKGESGGHILPENVSKGSNPSDYFTDFDAAPAANPLSPATLYDNLSV